MGGIFLIPISTCIKNKLKHRPSLIRKLIISDGILIFQCLSFANILLLICYCMIFYCDILLMQKEFENFTIYPVPGNLYPVHGTWYTIPGNLYPVTFTRYPLPGTLYMVPGNLYPVTFTRYPVHGTR